MRSVLLLLLGGAGGLAAGYLLWGMAGATQDLPERIDGKFPAIAEIEWDDGDSGKLRFENYPFDLDFRIKDWDAPETGGVGAAVGAAQCERERILGKAAEKFVEQQTETKTVSIIDSHGRDRTPRKRHLLELAVDGKDLASLASAEGHYKRWRHSGKDELEPRPDWCSGGNQD